MSRRPFDGRSLGQASALFCLLMGFFLTAFSVYVHTTKLIRSGRARQTTQQMADRVNFLIEERTNVLGALAGLVPAAGMRRHDQFAAWSAKVQDHVQSFDALMWVAKDGKTAWVVPAAPAQDPLKQPWVDPRELATYLKAAHDSGKAQLTHFLPLPDGSEALGLVYPVPASGAPARGAQAAKPALIGWLCGIFHVDRLVNSTYRDPEDSLYVKLEFPAVPGVAYVQGTVPIDPLGSDNYSQHVKILNQDLLLTGRYQESEQQIKDILILRALIVVSVVCASLVLTVLAYSVLASRHFLARRLEKEHLQSVLLNLLVHDIVNPLLIVRVSAEKIASLASDVGRAELRNIVYATGQISDVINRVKDIRSVELGKMHLVGEPVPVNDFLAATTILFEQRCRDKRITADFRPCPENPRIVVDRVIFQNNVINNIVSNAIKFSEPDSPITIKITDRDRDVLFEVIDKGVGMSEEIRSHLFLENFDVTKPGTHGEVGTGIGMLQVRSYTKLFGGSVSVASKQKTDTSSDHGTTVALALPKAGA